MIAGDFNIHWDSATNKEKLEFAHFLDSHNLKQHVEEQIYTKGHTIDLIITWANNNIIKSICVDRLCSAHHAIQCQPLVSKPPPVKKTSG